MKFNADLDSHKRFGLIAFFLLFGFGGIWAATAPIDGAAIAPGQVTVKSYSKIVQHLEGGIIKDIFVENGAFVEANEPILEIDNTQSLTELEAQNQRLFSLRALEIRLEAERDGVDSLNYPESFNSIGSRADEEMKVQIEIFNARRSANDGSMEILEQRIEQLQSEIIGYQGLQASKEKLADSFNEELADIRELLSQGFSDKNSLRALERDVSTAEGEVAELTATIASTEVAIGEAKLQILQEEKEFHNAVVSELQEVQANINIGAEMAIALEDIVSRTIVRAPDSGIVNGLQVHTIAGVITPGMRILDIVPQEDELIIESRVSPTDIDRVAVGQEANIRFSSFGMGTAPSIFGEVISVSADSLIDETSGIPHYVARVEVSQESLGELGDLSLVPGMPADVFISTGSRTFLQYVFKPLTNGFMRGLRED
jgi:epimerase transport system membrane fusion protein